MRAIKVIYVAMVTAALFGCASTAYKKAAESGNISGLHTFISKYPHHELCNEARTVIDSLEFDKARRINTVASYNGYISNSPTGRFVAEAKKGMDNVIFDSLRNTNTRESYEYYLTTMQNGIHRQSAHEALDNIFFKGSRNSNTVAAYNEYLEAYPSGKNRQLAISLIDSLEFSKAITLASIDGYKEYLSKMKSGHFRMQAVDSIKSIEYHEMNTILSKMDTVAAKDYISRFGTTEGCKIISAIFGFSKPFNERTSDDSYTIRELPFKNITEAFRLMSSRWLIPQILTTNDGGVIYVCAVGDENGEWINGEKGGVVKVKFNNNSVGFNTGNRDTDMHYHNRLLKNIAKLMR